MDRKYSPTHSEKKRKQNQLSIPTTKKIVHLRTQRNVRSTIIYFLIKKSPIMQTLFVFSKDELQVYCIPFLSASIRESTLRFCYGFFYD